MNNLIENLGGRGEKLLLQNLSNNEQIFIKLKGSYGEALVLTSNRLYVLKWGIMAGNTFGGRCNAFDLRNITSVEFRKNLLTGAVEILTPATQNSQKSFWGINENTVKADNIVSIKRDKFNVFFDAVRLIRDKVSANYNAPINNIQLDDFAQLEKISDLKNKGIITEEEFQAKKKQLLKI